MNKPLPQWDLPKAEPGISGPDLNAWREATRRLRDLANEGGLSRGEVARRSDVPIGTLTPWYDGTYTGAYATQTARVTRWLDAVAEQARAAFAMPSVPEYFETPTAREVVETLVYAQMMPEMVPITLGAGMGKTSTVRHYVATRPSAYLVTMRPTTSGKHAMLQEIALALDVVERNPARLDRAIGQKLKRNGRHTLLIVDEAQNLADDSVNQLRYFLDEYGCGIALLGNEEVHARWGSASPRQGQAQIHRRMGKRVHRLSPVAGDIDAQLDAWAIRDMEVRRLCHVIGRKPGALGQIDKTLRLAAMLARGSDVAAITGDHLRSAWLNRGGEDVR